MKKILVLLFTIVALMSSCKKDVTTQDSVKINYLTISNYVNSYNDIIIKVDISDNAPFISNLFPSTDTSFKYSTEMCIYKKDCNVSSGMGTFTIKREPYGKLYYDIPLRQLSRNVDMSCPPEMNGTYTINTSLIKCGLHYEYFGNPNGGIDTVKVYGPYGEPMWPSNDLIVTIK